MINNAILFGKSDVSIDYDSAEAPLHNEVVAAFLDLQKKAKREGFDLAVASSYRSYDRQLHIWNAKLDGSRPVFDSNNELLSLASLSPWEQVQAVLRWSALPGASRHHWGTDIDIYDRAAVSKDYKVQLSPEESSECGPFGSLHQWLDNELEVSQSDFFRPYDFDRGGVAPERWHISFAPIAIEYQRQFNIDKLSVLCRENDMSLKSVVLTHVEEIYTRFINVPITAYPKAYQ